MRFFSAALSLACLAGSALAQLTLTQINLPAPGSTLTAGCDVVVQVGMQDYIQNVDVIAIVIGLAECFGGQCEPASSFVGTPLYQGPYTPQSGNLFANYTVTIPQSFVPGSASLNVISLFLVGAEYAPVVNYLNENVTVIA